MTDETLITLTQAEQRYDVPRWCMRRWIDTGELLVAADEQAEAIKRLHADGLSMQTIATELGITKATVQRRLEGKRRRDHVHAADLERLLAASHTCMGCGEPIEPGRLWHPSCASHRPGTEEKRRATWTQERRSDTGVRMTEWWSDEQRRQKQSAHTKQMQETFRRAFDEYRTTNDLLDVNELVAAVGAVGWKDQISPSRVRALASEYGVGIRVIGFAGRARFAFTREEVEQVRGLLKTETKDGHCIDCGKPTYASVRCKSCGEVQKGQRLAALHEELNAQIDALKAEGGLRDLAEAAVEIDRAKSKVRDWAQKLGVGLRVPNILGLPDRWLFSEADLAQIRAEIDELVKRSAPDGMAAIRESTRNPEWHFKRFKTTRKYTEYAKEIATERGKKVGPKFKLADDERREIRRLRGEGMSIRRIAETVGVTKRQVERQVELMRDTS